MDSNQIRQSFLSFFKKRGHKIIPSSSLIPDDPSVLLTTAGMQQFKKYFTGELDAEKDFGTKNVVSIQKCFRTSDIDEVGNESHLTFFEMLGNFSFGGYWKKEAIEYAYEFITKELGLKIDYISVFKGDKDIPVDKESEEIWKSLGIKNIKKFSREDNFWGPTGNEGPCGPTTEIYINGVEIWNLVFNEFYCDKNKKLTPLKVKSVDTGMGLERLAMVVQKKPTIFETDLFLTIINSILSDNTRAKRIITDHIKGSVFLIKEGILPSNTERGYVLRRLLRRSIRYGGRIKTPLDSFVFLVDKILGIYKNIYPKLFLKRDNIIAVIQEEEKKFTQSLIEGRKILEKLTAGKKPLEVDTFNRFMNLPNKKEIFREVYRGKNIEDYKKELVAQDININQVNFNKATISGKEAFDLYQTYGFPLEMIIELVQDRRLFVDIEAFQEEIKKHQEISRAGAKKKFGGHGLVLDTGELKAGNEEEKQRVIRLHTATHFLHQALRDVLGNEVSQRGSDITPERIRFDFLFPRKMTSEEIKKVKDIVNEKIKESLPVNFREMPKEEAEKVGALKFFKGNYPDMVRVYYTGDSLENAYSKEFCGGPHVSNSGEIGEFKIIKEESSSAGIRRIRAIIS